MVFVHEHGTDALGEVPSLHQTPLHEAELHVEAAGQVPPEGAPAAQLRQGHLQARGRHLIQQLRTGEGGAGV